MPFWKGSSFKAGPPANIGELQAQLAALSAKVNSGATGLDTKASVSSLGVVSGDLAALSAVVNDGATGLAATREVADFVDRGLREATGARAQGWAAGEDFTTGATLSNGWTTSIAGAGAVAASGTSGADYFDGRASPGVGTALGRSAVSRVGQVSFYPHNVASGTIFQACRFQPLSLGTASDSFFIASGWLDGWAISGLGTRGVFVYYESQTLPNWLIVVRSASVNTLVIDTGIPVVTTDYVRWSLEIDSTGARAYYVAPFSHAPILAASVAPLDLPDPLFTNSQITAAGWKIEKLVTTGVANNARIDYINTGRWYPPGSGR